MTDEERQARRRASWARYNRSAKGLARYQRYEERNPERAKRWGPLMAMRKSGPPA